MAPLVSTNGRTRRLPAPVRRDDTTISGDDVQLGKRHENNRPVALRDFFQALRHD